LSARCALATERLQHQPLAAAPGVGGAAWSSAAAAAASRAGDTTSTT
jgi:hypothetical protein